MATNKYKFGKGKHATKAIHTDLPDGVHQAVGIGNLRVFVMPDGKFWFAQGLEIDYATQGDTPEQAKDNFAEGLASTIDLHLRTHGNITAILKPSDILQVIQEAVRSHATIHNFSQISVHDIGIASQIRLLFDNIQYFRIDAAV